MNYLKKKPLIQNDIETFNVDNKIAKIVSNFYKSNPFPNYKENDDKITISQRGDTNNLAKQFKNFVGYNKKILEVGCGTGQLSAYFATGNNNMVVSLDTTIESLIIGRNFAKKNNIENIRFINADIFDDVLVENFFDFIWCNGVLHHTENPREGFRIITKSLKKNGYILVGLYNRYGRIRTIVRKYFFKIFGKKFLKIFDPTLKNLKLSPAEQEAWLRDQYKHPQESLHTIDEVNKWFKDNNIDFISSIPSCDFESEYDNIFKRKSYGNFFTRIWSQFLMLFGKLGSDGGLFVVIGKKNGKF